MWTEKEEKIHKNKNRKNKIIIINVFIKLLDSCNKANYRWLLKENSPKKHSQCHNNIMEIAFSVRLEHQGYENEHKRDHKTILYP